MLIFVLTIVFGCVFLLSFAAAFVSFVCAFAYFQKVYGHFRWSEPERLTELMADPRARRNPMRVVLAVLREAANGDDQRVRLYADRVRLWVRYSVIAFAAACICALIVGLLDLGSQV